MSLSIPVVGGKKVINSFAYDGHYYLSVHDAGREPIHFM